MTRWYRAYEGTVTDAKLGEAALVASCSRSVAIATWQCILESCASVNEGGRYDTTPRRVAVILGEPPATIEAVFAELASLGMIEGNTATAWKRRQFESDCSTERSRKHREAKRNVEKPSGNGDATLQGRSATPPYTETDTDIPFPNGKGRQKPPAPSGALPKSAIPSRPDTAAYRRGKELLGAKLGGKVIKALIAHSEDIDDVNVALKRIEGSADPPAYAASILRNYAQPESMDDWIT